METETFIPSFSELRKITVFLMTIMINKFSFLLKGLIRTHLKYLCLLSKLHLLPCFSWPLTQLYQCHFAHIKIFTDINSGVNRLILSFMQKEDNF